MTVGSRVSIPSGVRRTIQDIKEMTGNDNDEEVYAVLRECGMDPNETAQKLLLQDTFHEVKKKRDKRKENNREPSDSRSRPGVLGRGGRGGRGSYSSHYVSHDAGGGRNTSAGKEIGVYQGPDKENASSSSPITPEIENKFSISTSRSVSGLPNGPTKVDHPISFQGCTAHLSGASGIASTEDSSASEIKKMGSPLFISGDVKSGSASGQSDQFSSSMVPTFVPGVLASISGPELVPSLDASIPGAVDAIEHREGSQSKDIDTIISKVETTINKATSQSRPSSSLTGSTSSRPSSNYGNRSQQLCGLQKVVGPSKEWKPKSTNISPAMASGILGTSDVAAVPAEVVDSALPSSSSMALDVTTSKLEKKLEDLLLSESQHVIIPHHLQVPESEKHGLCFGSFDASFKLSTNFVSSPASEDNSTPPSESSQEIEEIFEEPSSSIDNGSPTAQETISPYHPLSPPHMPENLSPREAGVSSGISPVPQYHQFKAEASLAPEGPHYSVHTAPSYSTFGLVPQTFGSQFAPFESTEPQARDATHATRLPSFVVQPPFDPSTSYYTQIYRPSADSDGRFSPFLAPGVVAKYNGNITVLPAQTGQSAQESGNSLVLSSAGPTALATQAGVMQSSIAVTQQPVPVFRQPANVHISNYPPNYIPYSQYFPPFYVPPPTLHHFLSNAAFPQQPPPSSMYPPPPAAAATAPVKYPISQYKPGTNTGNLIHIGMPTGYGTYNSTPSVYSPSPAANNGNSTGNEDLIASKYKENSAYITGQQSEGSAVWIPSTGRDMSGLQVNPFYNLPQGQHLTFAPAQAGHGALAGVYPATQTVAATAVHPLLQQSQAMAGVAEVVGPPAGVYQQPQRAQMNWANNY